MIFTDHDMGMESVGYHLDRLVVVLRGSCWDHLDFQHHTLLHHCSPHSHVRESLEDHPPEVEVREETSVACQAVNHSGIRVVVRIHCSVDRLDCSVVRVHDFQLVAGCVSVRDIRLHAESPWSVEVTMVFNYTQ